MVYDIEYSKQLLDKADDFLATESQFSGNSGKSKASFI